ncbi:hypothetical protein [Undibacterium sp.]|uniref:hypothetical protein n=1 Tax=Undibacterium sp. TaxID=1914977 RepID=UPI002D7E7D9A|nr:hypothetical protein [Undibacterium sp.]
MDSVRQRGRSHIAGKLILLALLLPPAMDGWGGDAIGKLADLPYREPIGVDLGFSYTRGNYSESVPSESRAKTLSVQWTAFDTDFQLSTSYLNRTAPAGTIITRVKKHVTVTPRLVTSSGEGDVLISANREILEDPATAIAVNLIGGANIAAADSSKGLGTGKNDYFLGLTASYPLEKALLSGGAKYSVLGSPGKIKVNGILEDLQFQNVWSGFISLSTEFFPRNTTAISFSIEQPSGSGTSYYQAAEISSSYRFSNYGGIRFYATKGATQNSPDWSAGMGLYTSF